jgi:hypothetical protein
MSALLSWVIAFQPGEQDRPEKNSSNPYIFTTSKTPQKPLSDRHGKPQFSERVVEGKVSNLAGCEKSRRFHGQNLIGFDSDGFYRNG